MASSLHEPIHIALAGCVRDVLVIVVSFAIVAAVLLAMALLVTAA